MHRILNLQKLSVPQKYAGVADSCTSSWSKCCNTSGN